MTQVRRLIFGTQLIVAMSVVGLIFVRVFLKMDNYVGSGPFTVVVERARFLVPIVIGGFLLFTAAWVVFGPVQRERTAQREVRRRR